MAPDTSFDRLAAEFEQLFAAGVGTPLRAGEFDALARRAFELQYEGSRAYRAFCDQRGLTPETVERWEDVPAVPATAFRVVDFLVEEAGPAEALFRTSGTTGDGSGRGRHLVPRLGLYRASLLPPFRRHVVPGDQPMPFLSLVPSPKQAPDSSLSFMVGVAAEVFALRTEWFAEEAGVLDVERFRTVARALARSGEPALVLGTAFAFVHLLDALDGEEVHLPAGSRVMETGGFKGRSREVSREELYAAITASLGVPPVGIVNEYGMTELLSQLYEPDLSEAPGARRHLPPPWMRVRALDPLTLEEVPVGRDGLLAFFDLANLGSICHLLTEDVGSVSADGSVRLVGRVAGGEPRGCSRAMDELLGAARGGL
jgi:Acyl-protein synthetase, LuxE